MRIYRIEAYNYGSHKLVGEGRTATARRNKADAIREYNRKLSELKKKNVRYRIALELLETPERLTAEHWIEFVEHETLPLKVVETLRSEKLDEYPRAA